MGKIPLNGVTSKMIIDYKNVSEKLKKFLLENGIQTEDEKVSNMLPKLDLIRVKKVTEDYRALVTDENGYIIKAIPFEDFVVNKNIPVDVEKGYYKLENGEIVIDYQRQRQIEEV